MRQAIGFALGRTGIAALALVATALALVIASLAACVPGISAPYPTFTPNTTRAAIPAMLTLTATAPTITVTPSPTPTGTPSPTREIPLEGSAKVPGAARTWIELGGVRLAVLTPVLVSRLERVSAVAGQAYLDMEVILENASDAVQPYSALYFRLVDGGQEIQPQASAAGQPLMSGDLQPGERVRGHLAFAVAAKDAEATAAVATARADVRKAFKGTLAPTARAAAESTAVMAVRGALSAEASQGLRLRYRPQEGAAPLAEIWVDLQKTGGADFDPGPPAPFGDLPGTGQRVEAAGIALTVDSTSFSERAGRTKASGGAVFLTLQVTIENISHTRAPFNLAYFKVRDAQGYEYRASALPLDELLQAGSLGEGQKVSGMVVFEVPAGGEEWMLKYRPEVLSEDYEEIRVRLSE